MPWDIGSPSCPPYPEPLGWSQPYSRNSIPRAPADAAFPAMAINATSGYLQPNNSMGLYQVQMFALKWVQ